jgi:excisionase family DNA binding protein
MTVDQAEMAKRPNHTVRRGLDARSAGLLGVRELADVLGTNERFVRRLVAERRLPFHKVGKYVRFDPRDIEAWLSEHRVESIS